MKGGTKLSMWYNEGKKEHEIAPLFFQLKAWFWISKFDWLWDGYFIHYRGTSNDIKNLLARLHAAGFSFTPLMVGYKSKYVAWLKDNVGDNHFTIINDWVIFEKAEDKTAFLMFKD